MNGTQLPGLLDEARREIDAVDAEMAALFCRRMDAVRKVAEYKQANGLPVLDAAREEAVVQKNIARLPDAAYAGYYEDFIRHTMGVSKAFQRAALGMGTVAYQGVEGAFSHIALTHLFPHAKALPYPTWAEVFDAVENGDAAYGVLPFENSQAGDVSEVLDLCYAHQNIHVCNVYDLPVSQNLLGVPGARLSDITRAVSHPQALQQSAKFIKSLGLETQAFPNTAAAAKCVAEAGDKSVAAIASRETAALYGLSILAGDINTTETNTTRFIVICKQQNTAGDRFSLLFTVEHRAGQLARVMEVIGARGFNLVCIKSRPMPQVPWEYYFYAEVEGDLSDEASRELIRALSEPCKTIRVLGVYEKKNS